MLCNVQVVLIRAESDFSKLKQLSLKGNVKSFKIGFVFNESNFTDWTVFFFFSTDFPVCGTRKCPRKTRIIAAWLVSGVTCESTELNAQCFGQMLRFGTRHRGGNRPSTRPKVTTLPAVFAAWDPASRQTITPQMSRPNPSRYLWFFAHLEKSST